VVAIKMEGCEVVRFSPPWTVLEYFSWKWCTFMHCF